MRAGWSGIWEGGRKEGEEWGFQSSHSSRESTHTSLDRPAARAGGSVTLQNDHNLKVHLEPRRATVTTALSSTPSASFSTIPVHGQTLKYKKALEVACSLPLTPHKAEVITSTVFTGTACPSNERPGVPSEPISPVVA